MGMDSCVDSKLTEIYKIYNNGIKPLIADIEARTQHFPEQILNEIRAFTDHVARCYLPVTSQAYCIKELDKAEGHIIRAFLDCYKILDIVMSDDIKSFDIQTRKIDLSYVDNGNFIKEYDSKKREVVALSKKARIAESLDKEKALKLYEETFNLHCEIDEFIESYKERINWAKRKFSTDEKRSNRRFWWTVVGSSIISFALGAVLNLLYSCL